MDPYEDQNPEIKSFNPSGETAVAPVEPESDEPAASVSAHVKRWIATVEDAKTYFKPQFDRMIANMDFVAGLQWVGQESIHEETRYVANFCLHQMEMKVAQLYARNPKTKARRKKRLDFKVWDGRMESILAAQMPLPGAMPETIAASQLLLTDYAQGRLQRDMLDKVGQTLETLFQWFQDNQQPPLKTSMKQLIRTVCICGVGYMTVDLVQPNEGTLSRLDTESTAKERLGRIKVLVDKIAAGDINDDSAEVEDLRSLVASLNNGLLLGEPQNDNERVIFQFPSPLSIIVDKRCTCLEGFVGARWIAQEFNMDLDEVNAFFGTEIERTDVSDSSRSFEVPAVTTGNQTNNELPPPFPVTIWKVWDLDSKSEFVIMQGHDDYVQAPQPIFPDTNCVWPIFALTFNKVLVDPNTKSKASVYPPSDIDIMRPAQKEWNRSRDSLRDHRVGNEPLYFTIDGSLSQEDIDKLKVARPGDVIPLKVPQNTDLTKIFVPRIKDPIDSLAHDTTPLSQDLYYTLGSEPTPLKPGSNKGTATAATIHEESRVSLAASNVDDLDTFLSVVANCVGEMCLKVLPKATVERIAGPGSVWTDDFQNKEDFVNLVYLDIVAASSGRPNKALEMSNWQVAAPILQAAGASPMFIAQETLRRLDETLEIDDCFPMGMQMPMGALGMGAPAPGQEPQASGPPPSGEAQPTRQNQFPSRANQTSAGVQ
jgi:hypothetical protein